jgi:DnaJ domain
VNRAPTAGDFATLGLQPGATAEEIRAAYRRLVKVHHPDRNPGDVEALATFRRLTESYAVLRSHAQARARPERSPLSAALARRRPLSRRTASEESIALAELSTGAALWVDAAAVLVGPDRATALDPGALGSVFPSAERVIRVERRPDGFHVFLPPQPSARWAVSTAAESGGLAVAALWVGDRQDDDGEGAATARAPLRLLTDRVGEMAIDDRGWVAVEALSVDAEGVWAIDLAQPVGRAPHHATPVRVLRDEDGFRVHSEVPAEEWTPVDAHAEASAAVLVALLAGVTHPVAGPPAV